MYTKRTQHPEIYCTMLGSDGPNQVQGANTYFVMFSTSSTPKAMWFRETSCRGAEAAAASSFQGAALLPFRGGTDFQNFSPR